MDKPIGSPAWGVLFAVAIVKILLHAYWDPAYGYFRDELYYLDCADHLAWGIGG